MVQITILKYIHVFKKVIKVNSRKPDRCDVYVSHYLMYPIIIRCVDPWLLHYLLKVFCAFKWRFSCMICLQTLSKQLIYVLVNRIVRMHFISITNDVILFFYIFQASITFCAFYLYNTRLLRHLPPLKSLLPNKNISAGFFFISQTSLKSVASFWKYWYKRMIEYGH